jgi:hypothetical protein
LNSARLEGALLTVGFKPDSERVWRWNDEVAPGMVVKIEFLADIDDVPNQLSVSFSDCESLGAQNLRGTGFAAKDWEVQAIAATIDGQEVAVEVRVATLPAYLLAKAHAAHGRGLTKDWYDIAYVLIHNDAGGPAAAASLVSERFGDSLVGSTATALAELAANFTDGDSQGSMAYASTMFRVHPDLDEDVLANDGVAGVATFISGLVIRP